MTFSLNAERPVIVTTRELDEGDWNLKVDGKPTAKVHVQQGRASFQLPAGEHAVELAR
jgi:hypothetical protein